jgi:hypothetical protein
VPVVEQRHSSLLIWFSISLLLFLLYIIYRRRQNKTDGERTFQETIPIREPSEYRLSVVQALPTIDEESPAALSPPNSNPSSPPLTPFLSTIPPLVLGKIKLFFITKTLINMFSLF